MSTQRITLHTRAALFAALLGVLFLLSPEARALEMNPDGYALPDLAGFIPTKSYHYDVNKTLTGMETFVELFVLPGDVRIRRFSIEGIIYGYTVQSQSGRGHLIIDKDGEGLFTARYGLDEPFDVPEWLVRRMSR